MSDKLSRENQRLRLARNALKRENDALRAKVPEEADRIAWYAENERNIAATEAKIAENETVLQTLREQIGAAFDGLRGDAGFVEACRALAWSRSGVQVAVRDDDTFVDLPEGWPKHINGDAFVASEIDARRRAHLAGLDRRERDAPPAQPSGPLGAKLAAMLEGGR